jgi:D-alanine-D-alanine ligase
LTRNGIISTWSVSHLADDIEVIASSGSVKQLNYDQNAEQGQHSDSDIPVSLGLHNHGNLTPQSGSSGTVLKPGSDSNVPQLDVVFPVLHGTFGEDGTVQGVLEMAGLPYVGCGVAASALAMDKALAKKVFESANIPQASYIVTTVFQWQEDRDRVISAIEEMLGYAVFVKPANLGSSVGVSKAKTRDELVAAIDLALDFDRKVVVETSMENCHEIECAILGNENPRASVLGEIIPGAEFYNYETKYIDDKSRSVIPAPLDAATTARVQALSIEAFRAIDGNGLARVDFFVHKDSGDIILNEVNTLPGFTPISMYPQLWAASGIPYPELIDRLIELAMENHKTKQSLKRAF